MVMQKKKYISKNNNTLYAHIEKPSKHNTPRQRYVRLAQLWYVFLCFLLLLFLVYRCALIRKLYTFVCIFITHTMLRRGDGFPCVVRDAASSDIYTWRGYLLR